MINFRLLLTLLLSCFVVFCSGKGERNGNNNDMHSRWDVSSTEDLMQKAKVYLNTQGKHDSAMIIYSVVLNRYYDESRPMAERERAAGAMNNLGYMYFYIYQDYSKSYSYLMKGLKAATENDFESIFPHLYLNLGNLYTVNGELSASKTLQRRAIEYYKKSFHSAVKNRNYDVLCIAVSNLQAMANKSKLTPLIKEEIDAFNKMNIPDSTHLLKFDRHICRAYRLLDAKRYAETVKECDAAMANVNAQQSPERFVISAMELKARAVSLMGDNDRAICMLGDITRIAQEAQLPDMLVEAYHSYSEYYKEQGNEALARKYRVMYLELKDSILVQNQLLNVGEMQFLDELNTANERMVEAQRQKEAQSVILRLVVAIAVVFLLMLVLLALGYRRQRIANIRLYDKSVEALKREATERTLRQKLQEQIALSPTTDDKKPKHQTHRAMGEEESDELMEKIERIMDDAEVICNPDFSVKRLAELACEKYWIVSQVINEKCGKNFNALLNDHRISEACRRMNDTANYGQFTIETISSGVGFKSRSNFISTFKRVTGLTPSEYQRLAKERNK